MTDVVERVARAMRMADGRAAPYHWLGWHDERLFDEEREIYRTRAQAALQALKPGDKLRDDGLHAVDLGKANFADMLNDTARQAAADMRERCADRARRFVLTNGGSERYAHRLERAIGTVPLDPST